MPDLSRSRLQELIGKGAVVLSGIMDKKARR